MPAQLWPLLGSGPTQFPDGTTKGKGSRMVTITRRYFSMPMTGYTKLFGSIVGSTIWSEDDKTRIVWITMLAMANQHGEVEASIPGLAKFAKVSIEATEHALEKLKSPDKYSRSKEFDGRRIEEIDGGWLILNHAKYREKASEDDRREQARIRAQRFRERNAGVTHSNAPVTQSNAKQRQNHKQKQKQKQENKEIAKQELCLPIETNPQGVTAKEEDARKKEPGYAGKEGIPLARGKKPAPVHDFIAAWCDAYLEVTGNRYAVVAGVDTGQAKRLIEGGADPVEIIRIARLAWRQDGFFARQAHQLSTFVKHYGNIRHEVEAGNVDKRFAGMTFANDQP